MGSFNEVSYVGIGAQTSITLKHSTLTKGTDEGKPVKISGNDTVALAADGDEFIGVVEWIETGFCTVGLDGMVRLVYDGDAPTVGYSALVSGGSGKVKVAVAGTKYRVFHVDTTDNFAWIWLKSHNRVPPAAQDGGGD